MEHLLSFFSDLILLTAGLIVAAFWLLIIMVCLIELHDAIFGDPTDPEED